MPTVIDRADPPATSAGTLWRSWIVYALSSVASRLVGFLMLPIYTRVLTPEQYGLRAMVTVGADVVGMVCALGLTTAMIRYYTGDDADGHRRPEAVSTAYATGTVVLGTGVALGMGAAPWLSQLIIGDAAYAGFLRLGLVSLFCANTLEIGLAYLRTRQRAALVACIAFAMLGLTFTTNLVFVVWLRWGVAGILYGEILTVGLFSLLLALHTLREVGLRFSPALARRMVAYGAPLTLMPLAWLVVNRSDGIFLTHHGSLSATGVYSLAGQCAQVLLVAVVLPFRDVWEPGQFDVVGRPDGGRTYRRMFQTFTFTAMLAALTFAVGAEDVLRVMAGPRFQGAAGVVPILLAAHVVLGVSLFMNSALLVRNRTAVLGGIALLTAAVNVASNAVLVPRYLAMGAAFSRVIALIVMAGVTYLIGRRLASPGVDLVALAKMTALALLGFGASRLLPEYALVVSLALKALLVLGVAVLGVLVGAIERAEVRRGVTLVVDRLRLGRVRPVAGSAP